MKSRRLSTVLFGLGLLILAFVTYLFIDMWSMWGISTRFGFEQAAYWFSNAGAWRPALAILSALLIIQFPMVKMRTNRLYAGQTASGMDRHDHDQLSSRPRGELEAKASTPDEKSRMRIGDRVTRSQFWLWHLGAGLFLGAGALSVAFFAYAGMVRGMNDPLIYFGPGLLVLFSAAGIISSLATAHIGRWHDLGRSGSHALLLLLGLIPILGWAVDILMIIILGLVDGNHGPNQYGPDPRGRSTLFYGTSDQLSTAPVTNNNDLLQRLKTRYALGEISEEEYLTTKAILEDD